MTVSNKQAVKALTEYISDLVYSMADSSNGPDGDGERVGVKITEVIRAAIMGAESTLLADDMMGGFDEDYVDGFEFAVLHTIMDEIH